MPKYKVEAFDNNLACFKKIINPIPARCVLREGGGEFEQPNQPTIKLLNLLKRKLSLVNYETSLFHNLVFF